MHVIVYCNEGPDQGYVYLRRKLADDEIMDAGKFAAEVARSCDREIEPPTGFIPNCFGDLRVEFTEHEPKIERDRHNECDRYLGSVCMWSAQSFYFKREEY